MGLASIMVRLGLDATGYQTGLKRAEMVTSRWGASMAASIKGSLAAMFSVAAVTAATRSVVSWADRMQDVSDDLKISTRTLQEWEFAAEGTRATLDDFVRAFTFLARNNPRASLEEVQQKFNKIAEAFGKGEISLGQLQVQLGRSSSVLAGPFASGLKQAADDADRLGRFLSEQQVKKIADMADAWEKAKGYMRAYFAEAFLFAEKLTLYSLYKRGFGRTNPVPERMSPLPLPLPKEEPQTTSKWSIASTNRQQQVGAWIGSQPLVVTEAKTQTKLLKAIADNTETIADNLDTNQ